jgi:hypothetical protein
LGFEPPILSYEDIRDYAEEFLAEYHPQGSVPTPIEQIVEFDFGMDIIPIPGLRAEVGVDAFLSSDLESIAMDEDVMTHSKARYRFSLAHELGHHWIHDELYQAVKVQTVKDWKTVQEEIGDHYFFFEYQANSFAGLILVPPAALKARFTRRLEEAKARGLRGADLLRHPLRNRINEGLAHEFEVSDQTMSIRLEKDGLLPPISRD